jgi:hypothetical protein
MNTAEDDSDPSASSAGANLPLEAAADLQDHLMSASMDLDRLQTLLADACDTLMQRFYGASEQMRQLRAQQGATTPEEEEALENLMQNLGGAVVALQFQDMASQLINHTHKRLRNCVDRLAREAFGDDEEGESVIEEAPLRPNPVTQAEMDVGSIELF